MTHAKNEESQWNWGQEIIYDVEHTEQITPPQLLWFANGTTGQTENIYAHITTGKPENAHSGVCLQRFKWRIHSWGC